MKKLGIIGARGYVGAELIKLLGSHDELELAVVSSRQLAGERVSSHFENSSDLEIVDLGVHEIPDNVDAWILALPNGHAHRWAEAILSVRADAKIVDLSADFRFDDHWTYGLTEFNRSRLQNSNLISNPGCYATAAQICLRPLQTALKGVPNIFGVSGFSGAGTTPSPKNDPEQLRDNLIPYALVDHLHEREISRHLGHDVYFMPHVAPFFRGITVTVSIQGSRETSIDDLFTRFSEQYDDEPLIHVQRDIPLVRHVANRHDVVVGGFAVKDDHVVVVGTLDNLLKGAATQALQNLNLSMGFSELEGIR